LADKAWLLIVFVLVLSNDELGQQIMLPTTLALAKRVFLGGVTVYGELSGLQKTPLPLGPTLKDAVQALGPTVGAENPAGRSKS
jgi:hypothetical protein